MYEENVCPLSAYRELGPLCDKGHVLLVQNEEDGQLYVKKRIRSYAPEVYRRLREEPAADTPRIYGIYPESAGDNAPAELIIIEEYLPGHTLHERLLEGERFSEDEVIRIGLALCRILGELHSRTPAIIHRDIKPSNVMLLSDGTVKLLDFSAAKAAAPREQRDTVLIGTAGFAAPEQYGFSGSTAQTDLYSLGVLLNVLRTGALPWERAAEGNLKRVIARCLKIDPKDRFAACWELEAALKRAGRTRIEWLPPGFRSLRWSRMLPAAAWYWFIVWFSLTETVNGSDPTHTLASRLFIFTSHLFATLFYGNYLDFQRFFPFMRSRSRALRILGLILGPFVALFLAVAVYLFVSAFCYATGRALFGS